MRSRKCTKDDKWEDKFFNRSVKDAPEYKVGDKVCLDGLNINKIVN